MVLLLSTVILGGYIMAAQSSYTTVKVSRFGFSVLSVTLNRVNTENVKEVVCNLITSVTNAEADDIEHINPCWHKSLSTPTKDIAFNVESSGDHRDDFSVYINHFDITEGQRRDAVHASPDTDLMFF